MDITCSMKSRDDSIVAPVVQLPFKINEKYNLNLNASYKQFLLAIKPERINV
jgi:hypothetical protein